MRLSEAIRLGAMLRPKQAFGVMFDASNDATCALAAAAEAVGVLDTDVRNGYSGTPPAEWKTVVLRPVSCPACALPFTRLDDAIIHANNEHRWTREAIADWVETRERLVEARADDAVDPQAGSTGNPTTREKE